ncbi:BamA/TamA family outer membrane protein [Aestuariibacter sp. GS-14]|uniref:BamA/TamA family outer membrane protein n=1 Tax=Aestuariibacter sp. GS-14 TaxID=2590670 RepID=UPI0015E84ED8|nr:BamA/TamA family outer membrane protein [Aestuariibacter sp. GS-14]
MSYSVPVSRITFLLASIIVAFECGANTPCPNTTPQQSDSIKVDKVVISTQNIFDDSDTEQYLLHRLANQFHISTKPTVIEERLPFKEGDIVTAEQLAEAERIIRKEVYIRDASVAFSDTCNIDEAVTVEVTTWDNWSMLPTVSFGRKGGKNKFELGVKEDNLLGKGIQLSAEYKTDEQRSGYRFKVGSQIPFIPYSSMLIDVEDNDDGSIIQFDAAKPFYQLSSENAWFINYLDFDKEDEIFQNGASQRIFGHTGNQLILAYGMLLANTDNQYHRLTLGYTQQEDQFYNVEHNEFTALDTLPQDRKFSYPWVEYEYLQADFQVLQDIYLTNQQEDINLGWHHTFKLGVETNPFANANYGLHAQWRWQKGYMWPTTLLMFSGQVNKTYHVQDHDLLYANLTAEAFYRFASKFGIYNLTQVTISSNNYADLPIALGGESGVRGYPLQYQHGDHRAINAFELRYYPKWNLYRMFDIGLAAFADVGKAWQNNTSNPNEYTGTLASTGIGARIYSNRSSHKHVIHLDIATPLTGGPNTDSWQWQLQVKQSF